MDTTLTHLLSALRDQTAMQSHQETYRNWTIRIEVAAHSRFEEETEDFLYVPRIVVTEHLSIGVRELLVITERHFPTPAQCLQGGLAIARVFIDAR